MSDYYRINKLIFIKPNLPGLVLKGLLFLKLTVMVRLGNRTYRVWRNIELPKYFIKLHTECRCLNTHFL